MTDSRALSEFGSTEEANLVNSIVDVWGLTRRFVPMMALSTVSGPRGLVS
jgi:hypothetical protein